MFRTPDEALENLHDLATRSRLMLNQPTIDSERAVHLFNMTAQLLEQFAWLDEYLSNHGTLPTDWRSACHRPMYYGKDLPDVDGTLRAHQTICPG